MKNYKQYFFEAAAASRIPHPEDSIFIDSRTAGNYVQALKSIATNPRGLSIKWDGKIALIFGIDPSGRFYINDKYMPDAFYAHSPQDWQKYDTEIKKSRTARPELYNSLAGFWAGLRDLVNKSPGVYKGDLMFANRLFPENNEFVFQPVTVKYRVPVNSSLGQLISGRQALIVVHQVNGSVYRGPVMSNNIISLIPPNLGIDFLLKAPSQLIGLAENAVSKFGTAADLFRAGMPKTYNDLLRTYLNKKITQRTSDELADYIVKNSNPTQIKFLLGNNQDGYLYKNRAGLEALFAIWNAIYALKENLASQLDPQVTGFIQEVNGRRQGEGFVFSSKFGLVKLVKRNVFGVAHFNGFNRKKMSRS